MHGGGAIKHSSWTKDKKLFPCLDTEYRAAPRGSSSPGAAARGEGVCWGLSDSRDLSNLNLGNLIRVHSTHRQLAWGT